MNLLKSKIAYPDFLRNLCLENINWYDTLLKKEDGFPEHVHNRICLTYFNISITTCLLIHSNISVKNLLPVNCANQDMSQIFTDSIFLALTDHGYNNDDAQVFLNELDKFINIFNEYRNQFDEETLKAENSNSHVLKDCSTKLLMDMLVDEKAIDMDIYADMNTSICQSINTIIIENMNTFNNLYNKYEIV